MGRYFFNGNWDNGSQDGAFTFNVNNASSNSNTNIGFRVANNRTARRRNSYGVPSSAYLFGSAVLPVKKENNDQNRASMSCGTEFLFLVIILVRYDNLWEKIVNFENIYDGYLEARTGRRYKAEIMNIGSRIEAIIYQMIFELNTGEWRPQQYYEFECRTEVKRRIINAPTFRDRVFHHALVRVVKELFERKFIYDSYACRDGKGTHKAVFRLQNFMRRAARQGEHVYILQCDISKYYPSIDHDILKKQIRRTIKDRRLLEAWDRLIDGFNGDTEKGMPIGALTSQLAANIYLNDLDHFAKECIGAKFYLRYMDDFIFVSTDKAELQRILADVRWFVECQLKLKLNPKTQIFPASHGVDFAGYRTFTSYILPRKRNVKAAKIRFKDISYQYRHGTASIEDARARVASFLGYTKHCRARKTTASTLRWLVLSKGGDK